jgi:diguanylate cyclase (GGDEF)-like protein
MAVFSRTPRFRLGALIALLTLAAPVNAQQYRFRYYGTEDGLTNLAVKVLFQDRIGFLWAATESGIFRFDGARFQRYGPDEGLPREVVVSLGEAPDGSVLAGSAAGLYRQRGDRFEKVALPGGATVGTYSGIRSDGQGRTYISTECGLVVATESAPAGPLDLHLLPLAPAAAGGPDVHGLLVEKDTVWYGCGTGLCRVRSGEVTVWNKANGLPPGKWTCIRRDGSGDLWVSDKGRVAVLRRGSGRFDASVPTFPPTAGGRQFEVDREGRLLVPTIQGLVIKEGQRFRTVGRSENLRAPVYSVLQDREGSIWVGLAGHGLARWQGYGEWDGFLPSSGLDSELIYEILPLGEGNLWVGTENGLFLGRETGDRWTWRLHNGVGKIPVHAVRRSADGSVWLGTEGYGAARVDSRTGEVEWFKKDRGLAGESPYSLAVDHRHVWAATERGLFVAELPARQFRRVEGVPPIRCWTVTEGPEQEILVGTTQGLFQLSHGRWRGISKADGLIDNAVLAIASAKPDEIWVGYWFSGTLTRIQVDGERVSLTHFGHEQGLRGELTYFLSFDARGRLWAGTDQGVGVRNGERWTHYNQSDGLVWNDCDLGGFAAEPDGSVWIGTSGGLSRFKPRPSQPQGPAPPVVFTHLTLGNVAIEKDRYASVGDRSNSLVAQYSALAFAREGSVLFRYRLEPLFSAWRETSLRELQFPGLPPNKYRLEVQARDEWGQWSEPTAAFAFEIRKPWWETWWSLACSATVALLIARGLWRWRVRQLVERQKELERIVADRTRELRERAMKDGLTGLLNRNAFFEALDGELARLRREAGSFALIMADLDFFKRINDNYGHLAGDGVLKESARRFVASVRPYDLAGRYGGEEFVMLMPGCGLEEATKRAEQVRQSISNQGFAIRGESIRVTCSFGVAVTNGLDDDPEALVQAADRALYSAKKKGRNRVEVYRQEPVSNEPQLSGRS